MSGAGAAARAVAFFDLDRTLLAVNSGALWLRRELRLGHVTRSQALRASVWLARYHLGFASMEDALLRAVASLAGAEAAPVLARTEAFFAEEVRGRYRPGALAALARHRAAGERLVLLTSSSATLADHVCTELGLDGALCNRFEVTAEGRYSGRLVGTLCYGQGKRTLAEACAAEAGAPLSACTFYTDSYADLPALEAVGHPVAVHPDPRLRREALRRGWPVLDWGAPGPG